jgi:hypothetical protein
VPFLRALFAGAALLFLSASATQAQTVMAFLKGEHTTGMTKQCFYNAMGSEYTRTISSVAICPVSLRVSLR